MRLYDYLSVIAPKIPQYYYALQRGKYVAAPLTITFSVTAACQSRCKTCHIGDIYLENPAIADKNLSLQEIEAIFKSLGEIYFFNISGGEPFMRPDLAEIVKLACLHLKPKLIHIPTNAIAPRFIEKTTIQILQYMEEYLPEHVPISIKPSIDGIGDKHDEVRGKPGNFKQLQKTIEILLQIKKDYPRLHVDLGTVISNYNLQQLTEIEDWVHAQGIESYRHEIAEQRAEFHNLNDPITPSVDVYASLIEGFKQQIINNISNKALLTRMTEAVRLVYYDLAVKILREKRQVTSCYAGVSNIHLNYDGELWPCCVLGGGKSLGNARLWNYDIPALLRSKQADQSRKYIADGQCACPLANQWLNNILLTPQHMLKVLYTYVCKLSFKN